MSVTGSARPEPQNHGSEGHATRLRDALEHATEHAAATQTTYDELLADPGVIQEDRDAAALLLAHARSQLNSAQLAVERLDAGEYGRCVKCGNDIGAERLAALVDVTTCLNCAD